MKYRVGDRVIIQSIGWIDLHKQVNKMYWGIPIGECVQCGREAMIEDMFIYAGAVATIRKVLPEGRYHINLDGEEWAWTDEMFERKVLDDFQLA